jgi:hypothetical protein
MNIFWFGLEVNDLLKNRLSLLRLVFLASYLNVPHYNNYNPNDPTIDNLVRVRLNLALLLKINLIPSHQE